MSQVRRPAVGAAKYTKPATCCAIPRIKGTLHATLIPLVNINANAHTELDNSRPVKAAKLCHIAVLFTRSFNRTK